MFVRWNVCMISSHIRHRCAVLYASGFLMQGAAVGVLTKQGDPTELNRACIIASTCPHAPFLLPFEDQYSVPGPLLLRGTRVGHPQMGHIGMWIVLSWKPPRLQDSGRYSDLPPPQLHKKNLDGPDPGEPSPQINTL